MTAAPPRHRDAGEALHMNKEGLTDEQLEQLLEVGRSLVSELDLETLLRRVLESARDLTGAAYAALGILNEEAAAGKLDRDLLRLFVESKSFDTPEYKARLKPKT